MKQKTFILFLFLLPIAFSSCIFSPSIKGNGNVVEEIRETGDFSEIKISRGMNVYLTKGDATKIIVKADENLLDLIETEVGGDELRISAKTNIRKATIKKVFVTTPNIASIRCSAGSNVFSENEIDSDHLELSCSAGSNMKMQVSATNIVALATAGSNLLIEGKTTNIDIKASSGSNIKAGELHSQNCVAKSSSGANIWITVENKLTGTASSGGNVFYYGNTQNTDIHTSSGGNVIKNAE